MAINFKTSEKNKERVTALTRALPGSGNAENIIARIALAYSLGRKNAQRFSLGDETDHDTDSRGKEYKDQIFFGPDGFREFYLALVRMHYGAALSEEQIQRLIKLHVDDGIETLYEIFENDGKDNFLGELCECITDGIGFLPAADTGTVPGGNGCPPRRGASGFSGAVEIEIGKSLPDGEPIFLKLNNEGVCKTAHIAFAGQSGSGKTQSAFEFLAQIHEKTGGKTKFIFLDFKGSKEADVAKFLQTTGAEFISPNDDKPFPLNPLSMIDAVNEQRRRKDIRVFADIVCACCGNGRLGAVQRNTLIDALNEAFGNVPKTGKIPTLLQLSELLEESYGNDKKKPDTLTSTIRSLAESSFFSDETGPGFLERNLYVSLGGALDKGTRFTALSVIVYYVYAAFAGTADAEISGDIRALRNVVFVDEAQNIFGNAALAEKLEDMLRILRSKGVSVCLASQEIGSFFTKNFDFSSQCETSVLLKVNDLNPRSVGKFLGVTPDGRLNRQIVKLSDGKERGVALVKSGKVGPAGTLAQMKFFHTRQK